MSGRNYDDEDENEMFGPQGRGAPEPKSREPKEEPKEAPKESSGDVSVSGIKNAFLSIASSSNILAIIAFFILVVILFTIALRLGVAFLGFIFSSKNNVKLITGIVAGNSTQVFPQDPSIQNAKTIQRSNNAKGGIEFTWSVWINVTSLSTNNQYQNIFTKGNYGSSENGINTPNNAPGLYLAPNYNTLLFIMNTFEVINEEILVPDLPMNKWVNVVMTCQNKTINIYINGVIAKSQDLIGVPKQNYGDVYVALGGGFNGYLSNLWYWNSTLGVVDIQRLYEKGPNTRSFNANLDMYKNKNRSNYLSLNWYLNGG